MNQSDAEAIERISVQIAHEKQYGIHTGADRLQKSGESPVASLVNHLLTEAIEARASDIHLEPQADMLRVRFRIDGTLSTRHELSMAVHAFLISRLKILSGLDIAEKRLPQDGRFVFGERRASIDVRVAVMPQQHGEKIVLRLLDPANRLLHIDELGFSEKNKRTFQLLCQRPYGMILNTGPVNSGKTTTLYAALQELNQESKNIITLEDPIEYVIPGINQIPVSEKGKLTFSSGMRSVLRQDPDIIMVGEIRDRETATIAVRAALTGHLVFSTLHTNGTVASLFRLLEMGVEPYLLAASLQGILAQRLVRRLCPVCHQKIAVQKGSPEMAFFQQAGYEAPAVLFQPQGCPVCNGRGYQGRIPLHEMLVFDDGLRLQLQQHTDIVTLQKLAEHHLLSMKKDAAEKLSAGETSWEEVQKILYEDIFTGMDSEADRTIISIHG